MQSSCTCCEIFCSLFDEESVMYHLTTHHDPWDPWRVLCRSPDWKWLSETKTKKSDLITFIHWWWIKVNDLYWRWRRPRTRQSVLLHVAEPAEDHHFLSCKSWRYRCCQQALHSHPPSGQSTPARKLANNLVSHQPYWTTCRRTKIQTL